MTAIPIGDYTATRVEQFSRPGGLWSHVFPDLTQEMLDRHLSWMVPNYFDPVSGGFITSIHSWVLRTPRLTILIDSCAGDGKQRTLDRYNALETPYLENLAAAGCRPEDVDVVLCTHMHVDHIGWNTRLRDGRWVPTFPNARYLFSRTEYDYWASEETRKITRATDIARIHEDSVAPVLEAGLAIFVSEPHEVDHGVVIEPAPGHTAGHTLVRATSRGEIGIFSGDVMHQPFQIYEPQVNSRTCSDPSLACETRRRLLDECAEHAHLLLPAHFGVPYVCRIRKDGEGFSFHPGTTR